MKNQKSITASNMAQKKDYDKLLFRLTTILTKLSNNEMPTLKELAEEFNVSTRTLQRDIYNRLQGFPIYVNTLGQLHFSDGFTLNRTQLSVEEVTTVTLALELIKNAGDEFSRASTKLMNKLLHDAVFNPYYIKPHPSERIDTDSPMMNRIEEAIEHNNLIRVLFSNGKEAELEPYKIVNLEGIWYLLGNSLAHGRMTTYFISAISDVKVLIQRFTPDTKINSLLKSIHTPFFSQDRSFDVTIEVHHTIVPYFENKPHLPSQQVLEKKENGNLVIAYAVSHIEEIDNLVKAWLPHICVIEPQFYRSQLADELQQYIAKIHTP